MCAPQAKMVTSVLCILMCGYNYFLILVLGSRTHILYAMKMIYLLYEIFTVPFLEQYHLNQEPGWVQWVS